ncbi:MAG: hypothetical protein CSA29_03375 [Desulfobacterales bacterium]|nr:MAG: hypothetical protein CSA29_03375 [Desulfobacterales bacterium]
MIGFWGNNFFIYLTRKFNEVIFNCGVSQNFHRIQSVAADNNSGIANAFYLYLKGEYLFKVDV